MKRWTKADREQLFDLLERHGKASVERQLSRVETAPLRGKGRPPKNYFGNLVLVWAHVEWRRDHPGARRSVSWAVERLGKHLSGAPVEKRYANASLQALYNHAAAKTKANAEFRTTATRYLEDLRLYSGDDGPSKVVPLLLESSSSYLKGVPKGELKLHALVLKSGPQ